MMHVFVDSIYENSVKYFATDPISVVDGMSSKSCCTEFNF